MPLLLCRKKLKNKSAGKYLYQTVKREFMKKKAIVKGEKYYEKNYVYTDKRTYTSRSKIC